MSKYATGIGFGNFAIRQAELHKVIFHDHVNRFNILKEEKAIHIKY